MCSQRHQSTRPRVWNCAWVFTSTLLIGCAKSELPNEVVTVDAAANAAESAAQQHLEAAKSASEAKDYSAAVEQYTIALTTMRDQASAATTATVDSEVLFERGVAYLNLGFPDTAAADFTEVLRTRPAYGAAYARRGEAYTKLGDLYKAVRDCTEAIRYEPECAYAYRYRGEAYLARGQFDRSVADLDQAVAMEPSLATEVLALRVAAHRGWAEQLAKSGEQVQADVQLARARALDPEFVVVTAGDAVDASDEAIELTAAKQVIDLAQVAYERGLARQAERQYDQALSEFSTAIDVRADFAEAYLSRGQTLMAMDFPDTAVKDLEQALRFGGESVEAYRLQTIAYMALGSPHRAALSATDALHVDPTDAFAYALRGKAYVALGNWDRGIVDLEEAIRRDPNLTAEVRPTLERAYRLRQASQANAVAATPVAG